MTAATDRSWSLVALDPAFKLPAALAFAALGSALRTIPAGLCACLFALGLALADRLKPADLLRKLAPVNAFFLFLWIFLPLSLDAGTPDALFHAGPLIVRASGLRLALLITLKGNAIALAVPALAGNGLNACCRALLRLRVPVKLVTLMLLTHGNIRLMRREGRNLYRAAKLRGFAPAASLWSWRIAAYLAAMLLLRSWERAERTGAAMRLRGFAGTFPLLDDAEPLPSDRTSRHIGLLLAGLVIGAGVLILILDRTVFHGLFAAA
jgi:cobalt/nickel transport system permease protein